MIHLSRSQVESSNSEIIPLGSSLDPSRLTVIGWSHIVRVKMCRPVRGVGSDTSEAASEESESDIEIGESTAVPGRVSGLMERGRPRFGDLPLLESGTRRVKPGSPKAGKKAVGVCGETSLDPDGLVRRVRLVLGR